MTKADVSCLGSLHEARYSYVQRASGWAGMFALPMVLSLFDDGDLLMAPVPELEALRGDHTHLSDIQLNGDTDHPLDEIRGDQLEIRAVFEWESAEEFGLKVCCSPDGEEQTLIRLESQPVGSQPCSGRDSPSSGVDTGRKSV